MIKENVKSVKNKAETAAVKVVETEKKIEKTVAADKVVMTEDKKRGSQRSIMKCSSGFFLC